MKEQEKKQEQVIEQQEEQSGEPIPPAVYSTDEEWVKQHQQEFSEDPTFF